MSPCFCLRPQTPAPLQGNKFLVPSPAPLPRPRVIWPRGAWHGWPSTQNPLGTPTPCSLSSAAVLAHRPHYFFSVTLTMELSEYGIIPSSFRVACPPAWDPHLGGAEVPLIPAIPPPVPALSINEA